MSGCKRFPATAATDPSELTSPQAPETQQDGGAAVPAAALFSGPRRYRAVTPWGPLEALAVAAVATLLLPLALALPLALYRHASGAARAASVSLASPDIVALQIAGQLATIGVIWALAGRAGLRADTLQFRQPPLTLAGCAAAALLAIAATSIIELAMYAAGAFDPVAESSLVLEGLRSPYWPATVIIAVVLAPIAEELTFRGFLLTALAKALPASPAGFLTAGLASNTLWTLLHAVQYSGAGLASVFVSGLVLTWLMWRTASIRACIVAHAIINASALLLLGVLTAA